MQCFYIEETNNNLIFSSKDIHHIVNVLRKREEDLITCYNLKNKKKYICKIKSTKPFSVSILEKNDIDLKPFNINIYLAIIKKNSIELVTKILNELNVNSITFVWCEFSQRNNYVDYKRLNCIALESCKQSNRFEPIKINKAIDFTSLLDILKKSNSFCAHLNDNKIDFVNLSLIDLNKEEYKNKGINLLIGPEAGFSKNEILLIRNNVYFIELTPTILKSETATIFLASIFVKIFL